ncbi:MAG TPA: hypothetical protein DDX71_06960 [Ruminococcus sp.]|nr:hypothetical protein [Ruminococcus sp.]
MKYLPLLPALLLLTACTDIRSRISPDILAADAGTQTRFAMHASQSDEIVTADAEDPCLLRDALANASGAEISAGHLSMLLLGSDPAAVLLPYFRAKWLPPTCAVLAVPAGACDLLCGGNAPSPDALRAAVETGLLPARTADAVIGDLLGGSGMTAMHCHDAGTLTLLLCDAQQSFGTLSPDACRGLALLGGSYQHFDFAAADGVHSVTRARLHLDCKAENNILRFTVNGRICVTNPSAESEAVLCGMLSAALAESCAQGADILMLRETAVRCGESDAAFLSQMQWREKLRSSVPSVQIEQSAT